MPCPTLKDTLSMSAHPWGPTAFKLRAQLPLPRHSRHPHHITAAMATATAGCKQHGKAKTTSENNSLVLNSD